LGAPDRETARMLLKKTLDAYEKKAPRAMKILEEGFDNATAILSLPERYRRCLRTTNSIERLNEEIRRRKRVIHIFPNRESIVRLIGTILLEIDNKWAGGRKYLDMAYYLRICSILSIQTKPEDLLPLTKVNKVIIRDLSKFTQNMGLDLVLFAIN